MVGSLTHGRGSQDYLGPLAPIYSLGAKLLWWGRGENWVIMEQWVGVTMREGEEKGGPWWHFPVTRFEYLSLDIQTAWKPVHLCSHPHQFPHCSLTLTCSNIHASHPLDHF